MKNIKKGIILLVLNNYVLFLNIKLIYKSYYKYKSENEELLLLYESKW